MLCITEIGNGVCAMPRLYSSRISLSFGRNGLCIEQSHYLCAIRIHPLDSRWWAEMIHGAARARSSFNLQLNPALHAPTVVAIRHTARHQHDDARLSYEMVVRLFPDSAVLRELPHGTHRHSF